MNKESIVSSDVSDTSSNIDQKIRSSPTIIVFDTENYECDLFPDQEQNSSTNNETISCSPPRKKIGIESSCDISRTLALTDTRLRKSCPVLENFNSPSGIPKSFHIQELHDETSQTKCPNKAHLTDDPLLQADDELTKQSTVTRDFRSSCTISNSWNNPDPYYSQIGISGNSNNCNLALLTDFMGLKDKIVCPSIKELDQGRLETQDMVSSQIKNPLPESNNVTRKGRKRCAKGTKPNKPSQKDRRLSASVKISRGLIKKYNHQNYSINGQNNLSQSHTGGEKLSSPINENVDDGNLISSVLCEKLYPHLTLNNDDDSKKKTKWDKRNLSRLSMGKRKLRPLKGKRNVCNKDAKIEQAIYEKVSSPCITNDGPKNENIREVLNIISKNSKKSPKTNFDGSINALGSIVTLNNSSSNSAEAFISQALPNNKVDLHRRNYDKRITSTWKLTNSEKMKKLDVNFVRNGAHLNGRKDKNAHQLYQLMSSSNSLSLSSLGDNNKTEASLINIPYDKEVKKFYVTSTYTVVSEKWYQGTKLGEIIEKKVQKTPELLSSILIKNDQNPNYITPMLNKEPIYVSSSSGKNGDLSSSFQTSEDSNKANPKGYENALFDSNAMDILSIDKANNYNVPIFESLPLLSNGNNFHKLVSDTGSNVIETPPGDSLNNKIESHNVFKIASDIPDKTPIVLMDKLKGVTMNTIVERRLEPNNSSLVNHPDPLPLPANSPTAASKCLRRGRKPKIKPNNSKKLGPFTGQTSLQYTNKSPPLNICIPQILSRYGIKLVWAKWKDGNYYPGTVNDRNKQKISDSGFCTTMNQSIDNGNPSRSINPTVLINSLNSLRLKVRFCDGDFCQCLIKDILILGTCRNDKELEGVNPDHIEGNQDKENGYTWSSYKCAKLKGSTASKDKNPFYYGTFLKPHMLVLADLSNPQPPGHNNSMVSDSAEDLKKDSSTKARYNYYEECVLIENVYVCSEESNQYKMDSHFCNLEKFPNIGSKKRIPTYRVPLTKIVINAKRLLEASKVEIGEEFPTLRSLIEYDIKKSDKSSSGGDSGLPSTIKPNKEIDSETKNSVISSNHRNYVSINPDTRNNIYLTPSKKRPISDDNSSLTTLESCFKSQSEKVSNPSWRRAKRRIKPSTPTKNQTDDSKLLVESAGPLLPKGSQLFQNIAFLLTHKPVPSNSTLPKKEYKFNSPLKRTPRGSKSETKLDYLKSPCSVNMLELSSSNTGSSSDDGPTIEFNKQHLTNQIVSGGGLIFESYSDIHITLSQSQQRVLCIADTYLRTEKYLKCLACDIPILTHIYIIHCCKKNLLLDYENYMLPAGRSLLTNTSIPRTKIDKKFTSLKIMLIMSPVMASLNPQESICYALVKFMGFQIIVGQNLELSVSQKPNIIVAFKQDVQLTNIAKELGIAIVNVEWVIQSLIHGECIPWESHEKLYSF
ncbi:unnamed protein product [Gordionus sp. m RMFG-2023]